MVLTGTFQQQPPTSKILKALISMCRIVEIIDFHSLEICRNAPGEADIEIRNFHVSYQPPLVYFYVPYSGNCRFPYVRNV